MTPHTYSANELAELIQTLPRDIRDILSNESLGPAIFRTCQEKTLDGEKSLVVEDVVADVLVGKLHPRQFISTLTKTTGASGQVVEDIVTDLLEHIFEQVEDSLKQIYGFNGSVRNAVLGESESGDTQSAPSTPHQLEQHPDEPAPAAPNPPQNPAVQRPDAPETLPGAATASTPPPNPPQATHTPEPPIEPKTPADTSDEKTRPSDENAGGASPEISTSIFEEKLKKASLPPQAQEETSPSPAQKPQQAGADPYRESIE